MLSVSCKEDTNTGRVNVVREYGGWKTPQESWMDLKAAEEKMFIVNIARVGEEELMESERTSQEE